MGILWNLLWLGALRFGAGLSVALTRFHWEMSFFLRSRAADLRRSLDTVIMQADRRTDQLSQGKTQMKMPDDGDWGWRPDVFATRLGQMSSVVKSARHDVGKSIAVHHNDTDPELIVRQFKNMGSDDLAPYRLSVETYEFKGSFLSLAIDLPSEAAKGLTKTTFLKWKANCHWITQCLYSCD